MPRSSKPATISFAALRFAAAWLLYLSLRAIVLLPLRCQIRLAKRAGGAVRGLLRARRRVVDRNLEACFPEQSAEQREALAVAHFEALGASLAEMAMGWYGSEAKIAQVVRVDGREHLDAALANGRGVILFSGHFTSFEIFFPVLGKMCPRLCGMYKVQRNRTVDEILSRGRLRNVDRLFAKDSVRGMLKELAANSVVWYASDQSYTGKGSALIPFFGVPAMTNTAIARIARISGATVLPYFCKRTSDEPTYQMTIGAPLEGFPSTDTVRDTRRLVELLENYVLTCPEQYWWVHQRFKSRPPPYPDLYGDRHWRAEAERRAER
jgi:Kdo2-lipid IVA lauroyltransferase/acyltransferase